ncbi:right-handed parallel beta-helix repeat-containing protein [Allokutzneria albata]|uniref:Parallel beta-helix repeat (Two copies) n=1 Tax=Allokutzneria albata TaxID=211114 RepID=A0A1G9RFM4_ALLAB|nr:right-handed parallel beta-helix repeat-containing protein [Allokutzneria albata]SDM22058.1 parallel beta-helix repeat (two copies) [Allokutzneria albata]
MGYTRRAFLGAVGAVALGASRAEALPDYISGKVIQEALNRARDGKGPKDAAGRFIAKPGKGTYLLTEPLIIHGNTHLDVTGIRIVARFPATGVKKTMVLNAVSASTGGYAAPGNIAITGGSWDPTWDFFQRGVGDQAPPMNVITLIHTKNVVLDGVTIYNTKHWHAIELNAIRDATVRNCALLGWIADPKQGLWHGEALQLDLPTGANTWAGKADGTPCRNIVMRGNTCDKSGSQLGFGQFTGSHTTQAGMTHSEVLVEGNTVRNARWDGIGTLNWQNVRILNNTAENCEGGIYVKSADANRTVEITGNKVSGTGKRAGVGIRAVKPISDVVVSGNTVTPCSFSYVGDIAYRSPPQRC